MKKTMNNLLKTTFLVVVILLAACVGSPQIDEQFGNAVHTMNDVQIYDRNTLENPSKEIPVGQDGLAAVGKLEGVYRESQSSKKAKQTFKSQVFRD